jgi:site-specific recombinase XerD
MGQFSRWLEESGRGSVELSTVTAVGFLQALRERGRPAGVTVRSFAPLLAHLEDLGVAVAPRPVVETPAEALLGRYRRYLREERGLAEGTIGNYEQVARLFVGRFSRCGELDIGRLTAAEVSGFVLGQCRGRGAGEARNMVSSLRSLLRFLHVQGETALPLAQALPAAPAWCAKGLPQALAAGQAQLLLTGCDRRQVRGCRDYAILTVLVRLGLRAGEVSALALDDLDWRVGEVVVRGKGRRSERLPLPVDVGRALVDYLDRGRPRTGDSRVVFLRAHAPHRGLTASGVTQVVWEASERAGLPRIGAHRLRHTAATEMLRAGASLAEVGQVLRHRSAATTALYAKVDQRSLAPLAGRWPGSPR